MRERYSFLSSFFWCGFVILNATLWFLSYRIHTLRVFEFHHLLRYVVVGASVVVGVVVLVIWKYVFTPSRVKRFLGPVSDPEKEALKIVLGFSCTLWMLIVSIAIYSFMGRILAVSGSEVHLLFLFSFLLLLITRRTGSSYLKFVEEVKDKV